jgi:hypothetical protein
MKPKTNLASFQALLVSLALLLFRPTLATAE